MPSWCPEKATAPHSSTLPWKIHGWRSLVGCCLWGCEESDTTERLHFHFSLSSIGEGNGNPLQCSCLENPRDGGAWWAGVCGVAQSRVQLKRLSSSSSIVMPLRSGQQKTALASVHHQSAWQVAFPTTSHPPVTASLRSFHRASVRCFIAFETSKQKGVDLLLQTSHPSSYTEAFFKTTLIVRSTRDLLRPQRKVCWEKRPQQFKTLLLGFILSTDRGTLEEHYALWRIWSSLEGS